MSEEIIIHRDGTTAYFTGVKAAVLANTDTRDLFKNEADKTVSIEIIDKPVGFPNEAPAVVPWGTDNKLPMDIIDKVNLVPQMTSNMWFNIVATYGEGVRPVRITTTENGKQMVVPYEGNEEVKTFFENNDTGMYLLEQCTDFHWFFNAFPEIVFNREKGERRRIVEIQSKEACFSRWSEMSTTPPYRIDWHYYFAYWGVKTPEAEKYPSIATRVLDHRNPVRHLREILEETKDKEFNQWNTRYIVPVSFPTPGRNYYQQPYWYSLITSGWYDFAVKIPEFKKTLLQNISYLNYIVLLAPGYFEDIFKREKISDAKAQETRIKKEYADINSFLKGTDKSGKSIITFQKKDPTGQPYPAIKIEVVKNELKGGEYIEDSEEVSNIIAYGMLVHPSLVGAAPGANKSINGTEARELFIIKQALLKPFRDRLLRPFYLIKAINKWPEDLHFVIPNIELTTLDADKTGSTTNIDKTV